MRQNKCNIKGLRKEFNLFHSAFLSFKEMMIRFWNINVPLNEVNKNHLKDLKLQHNQRKINVASFMRSGKVSSFVGLNLSIRLKNLNCVGYLVNFNKVFQHQWNREFNALENSWQNKYMIIQINDLVKGSYSRFLIVVFF